VHIWGVELESQARLAPGLDAFAALGTTSTDIVQSTEFPGVDGNYTPKTVPWKLNLALQYVRPITNDIDGFFRIDYEHRAKEYWQIDNLDVQNPINLVNLKIGVTRGRYEVYFWSRNLTNTQYYEDYNPSKFSGLPYDLGSLAEPRTYGIEIRAHI
jgi:iron complex outermembrane receptor protein